MQEYRKWDQQKIKIIHVVSELTTASKDLTTIKVSHGKLGQNQ
jgi:hypothetical protein